MRRSLKSRGIGALCSTFFSVSVFEDPFWYCPKQLFFSDSPWDDVIEWETPPAVGANPNLGPNPNPDNPDRNPDNPENPDNPKHTTIGVRLTFPRLLG